MSCIVLASVFRLLIKWNEMLKFEGPGIDLKLSKNLFRGKFIYVNSYSCNIKSVDNIKQFKKGLNELLLESQQTGTLLRYNYYVIFCMSYSK